jgi:hypothetical protein
MKAIETFEVNDKVVEIHIDDNPENPRDSSYQDNCDMFILFHKRYNLGDKHDYKSQDYSNWDEMEDQIFKDLRPVEMRRIYLYDHSGLTISDSDFGDRWDSGMIGFALITREAALYEMSAKKVSKKVKDWAKKYLTATINEYRNYLEGNVYGYIIKDKNDNELESCWGFNGEIDYVKKEAIEVAKGFIISPKLQVENKNQLSLALV